MVKVMEVNMKIVRSSKVDTDLTKQIVDDLKVNNENLDECLDKQSALSARYGVLHATSERDYELSKIIRDETYANVEIKIRGRAKTLNKSYTEAQVKALITIDPEYMRAIRKVVDLRYEMNKREAIYEGIRSKQFILQSKIKKFLVEYYPEISQKFVDADTYAIQKVKSDIIHDRVKKVVKPYNKGR